MSFKQDYCTVSALLCLELKGISYNDVIMIIVTVNDDDEDGNFRLLIFVN